MLNTYPKVILASVLLLTFGSASLAQEPFQAQWGTIEMQQPVLVDRKQLVDTRNGKAMSVLFDPLRLESIPGDRELTKRTYVAFQAPVRLAHDEALIGVVADLAGKMDRNPSVRGRVFLSVGNASRVLEFAPGEGAVVGQPLVENPFNLSIFDIERWPSEAQSPKPVRAPPPSVTLLIEAQKSAPEDTYLLTIDSLDLALAIDKQAVAPRQ